MDATESQTDLQNRPGIFIIGSSNVGKRTIISPFHYYGSQHAMKRRLKHQMAVYLLKLERMVLLRPLFHQPDPGKAYRSEVNDELGGELPVRGVFREKWVHIFCLRARDLVLEFWANSGCVSVSSRNSLLFEWVCECCWDLLHVRLKKVEARGVGPYVVGSTTLKHVLSGG
ncbi:uncharacterized protein LOC111240997 [Vigna radiata var. radiata]|uniref:Uncharacterized protein LOC111240997 n=1 Tax=Vigna radiata var. radiata TaxID=3916 RepID=A0A3Q0EPE8_VIGRR|nr:uncharacterized protein LOC111240997 [Vigna radiata var. radiata]